MKENLRFFSSRWSRNWRRLSKRAVGVSPWCWFKIQWKKRINFSRIADRCAFIGTAALLSNPYERAVAIIMPSNADPPMGSRKTSWFEGERCNEGPFVCGESERTQISVGNEVQDVRFWNADIMA
jgi:hypothetical protein